MTATGDSSAHPEGVAHRIRELDFVCPLCRGPLRVSDNGYRCSSCVRDFPVFAGVPDFRVYPDRFLSADEDRERSRKVLEVLDRLRLPELLEYYWRLSDFTPEPAWRTYIAAELRSEARARRALERLEPGGRLADVGCGTGGMLVASARQGLSSVGMDIAMRWLHVARRRFMDAELEEPALVCCCADHLPFRTGSFDNVVCMDTLEFSANQAGVIGECARIVEPPGRVFIRTANRFSLLKDSYSQLWGVGLLPRRWQAAWVRRRRGVHFENLRLLSLAGLRRLLRSHFRSIGILPSEPPVSLASELPGHYRVLLGIYRRVSRVPILRRLLIAVAPHWDVTVSDPVAERP